MRNFFRSNFGRTGGGGDAMTRAGNGMSGGSTGFAGLLNGLKTGGNELVYVALLIAFFAGVIMLTVAFIMLFMSKGGKERDDAKQRVTRTLISVALISMAATVVTTIFFAFYSAY